MEILTILLIIILVVSVATIPVFICSKQFNYAYCLIAIDVVIFMILLNRINKTIKDYVNKLTGITVLN